MEEFFEFAGDSIYVAHNARFDLSFLRAYSHEPLEPCYIDTLSMARQLLDTEKHSLDYLVDHFDLSRSNPHRAGEDASATAELFLLLTKLFVSPEDYFRCQLPQPILEQAPVPLPEPDFGSREEEILQEVTLTDGILFGLSELDTRLGVNKLAKILSGSEGKSVRKYTSLDFHGIFSSYRQKDIKEAIEKTIEEGLVVREGEQYPVLNLTDRGIQHLINSVTR